MSQKINPTFGNVANQEVDQFSLVAHFPELPAASSLYENSLFYNKADSCFYKCSLIEGNWYWERVTHGTSRHYVLPVNYIVVSLGETELVTFNKCVSAINAIVASMKSIYNDSFDPLSVEGSGATLENAIDKYNEIVVFVNRVCGTELVLADSSEDGDTVPSFTNKLNLLIGVLNPHAEEAYWHVKVDGIYNYIASLDPSATPQELLTNIITFAKSITEGA